MSEKTREICTVVSQESIGAGIYSMWIQTDRIAADAKPGQFVSLYTNDRSKILPRPISLCEIDKENGRLHLVYRVTGQGTGTDEFSQMKAGDTIPVLGPLGNGFPVEKAEGKTVFLMGGGIGVPPILELAKQMKCEKKQIIAGYRDCHTFLREEFEAAGKIIELRAYHTVYGIWKYFTADDGQICLTESDYLMIGTLEAYEQIRDYFGAEKVCPVYVEVDDGLRLQRALDRERAQDQPKYAEMCRRFLADEEDFSEENLEKAGITKRFYNTDLDQVTQEIASYIM